MLLNLEDMRTVRIYLPLHELIFKYFAVSSRVIISEKPSIIGLTPFVRVKVYHFLTSHNNIYQRKAKGQVNFQKILAFL
jgi:hypothetical protein